MNNMISLNQNKIVYFFKVILNNIFYIFLEQRIPATETEGQLRDKTWRQEGC